MQTTLKAGTTGWFEHKHQGADVAEFSQDTPVLLKASGNASWLITDGPVPGFPGAPRIFVSRDDVCQSEGDA